MNGDYNFQTIQMSLMALAGGLFMLASGGEFLVSGATKLAERWGMSILLIGLTVVAFGTSMPELFVSLAAIFQGYPDIMTGNIVGSNIANIGLILGICALLTPVEVKWSHISKELYMMIAVSIIVILIAWHGNFSRFTGILFVIALVLFTLHSFRVAYCKKSAYTKEAEHKRLVRHSYPYIMIMIVGGFLFLAYGSGFFIDGAVDVARHFGISELIIGLTLAAIGTSLPELAASIAAVRRRQSNLLIGNVVGSNLFNFLMVFGCAGIIKPFTLSPQLLGRDLPVMLAFSAVLVPTLIFRHRLDRLTGLFLLGAYLLYLLLLQQ